MLDPDNVIIRLCAQGMEEESHGKPEEALRLFERAWRESHDDFERCIAAHYVARHQVDLEAALRWNTQALECANRVEDARASEFYASLHLNLGKSNEDLGVLDEARRHYRMAAKQLGLVPSGHYRDILREGIERALKRVGSAGSLAP